MTNYRKIPVYLLFVTAVLFAAGAIARGGSITPENKVPDSIESKAQSLTDDLKQLGFEVSRGYFKLYTVDDCDYTFDKIGSCYGNNPAAPYATFAVPPWPEEFVDPVFNNMWGPSQEGYNDIYRLDPREAIIILGQLPPPAAFFSEQTWIFTREGTYDKDSQRYKDIEKHLPDFLSIFFANVPDHPERIQVLSSLSNPNNNVVIERQSGAAFDQIRYFIITPDQVMDQEVRKAFSRISVEDKNVFTEPIPSDMKVGLNQGADDFTHLMRYVKPDDGGGPGTGSDTWRKDLPLVVLRVRDARSDREPQPYPPVELEARTAQDELYLKPDLLNLVKAVGERWEQPCATADCSDRAGSFTMLQEFPTYMVGPLCLPIGQNCLLDTLDTAYQLFGPMPLDNGEIYAVAGTLGTETGNATYVGFGINQRSRLVGVANLFNDDLKGTANGYAGKASNTGKFYLYYFTRDCSGLEDFTDGHCFPLSEQIIPAGDQFIATIRDYIKQGTQRGPDSAHVLPSMVLKLQRP
jgi:hypothetical protein